MTRYAPLAVAEQYVGRALSYVLFDHLLYTPYELDRAVIAFALEHTKWQEDLTREEQATLAEDLRVGDARGGADPDDSDHRTHVYYWAEAAIDYLNEHYTFGRAWWGHDGTAGAFGCWVDPDN